MQLTSCEFAAARGAVPAARSCQRPSLMTTPAASSTKKKPAAAGVRCAASRSRGDDAEFSCGSDGVGGSGRMVDEGMVVLRRRIHEMRAAERNWEPPAEWAAWEKEWYGTYDADVCDLVAALQALLLSARPGVGVGPPRRARARRAGLGVRPRLAPPRRVAGPPLQPAALKPDDANSLIAHTFLAEHGNMK
ncbi:hypothetical protein EJB05_31857, partial [Eragrostis curvula]